MVAWNQFGDNSCATAQSKMGTYPDYQHATHVRDNEENYWETNYVSGFYLPIFIVINPASKVVFESVNTPQGPDPAFQSAKVALEKLLTTGVSPAVKDGATGAGVRSFEIKGTGSDGIRFVNDAGSAVRLDVVDSRGAVVRRATVGSGSTRLPTTGLAGGGYYLLAHTAAGLVVRRAILH